MVCGFGCQNLKYLSYSRYDTCLYWNQFKYLFWDQNKRNLVSVENYVVFLKGFFISYSINPIWFRARSNPFSVACLISQLCNSLILQFFRNFFSNDIMRCFILIEIKSFLCIICQGQNNFLLGYKIKFVVWSQVRSVAR